MIEWEQNRQQRNGLAPPPSRGASPWWASWPGWCRARDICSRAGAQKGLVFLVVLPLMFAIGLWLQGRLFPLELSDPLVFLGAIANRGIGAPYVLARLMDAGAGTVTAASYEYGNTFLMTAGLLNFLVILDAFDVVLGRK